MDIAIMVEGQNGLNWERWQRLARAVEDLGFAGLFRSDHFVNADGPDLDSLELWASLTWLAGHTQRIQFGPLVSPVSFRHPVITARIASAVDDLSGGRLTLGLGAGWQEREHTRYGFNLLDTPKRFARLEEALEIITLLLHSDVPVSFSGHYYRLQDAILLPRPQRPKGPPILIGGNGAKRTLPLVACYADEWNAVFLPPAKFAALNAQLDTLLRGNGRNPSEVRRSMMTTLVTGRSSSELQKKLGNRSVAQARERGALVGTPTEIKAQLEPLASAGVQRIMLQWLDLDDLNGLEALAGAIL